MENKVLLELDDFKITELDVEKFLMTMGQEGAQFNNEEGKKQIALEMMNQHLIYLDAKEKGLENDPDYLAELEIAKEQILRQVSMKKLLSDVQVTEEEAKKYYEDNKEKFKKIYTYRASHILVDDENKANELKARIDQGESFEEIAKSESTCPSSQSGGDLGLFSTGQMVPEFEIAASKLEIGQISAPVKSQFGYHIIKLVEKNLARDDDFDSNINDIRNILLGKKQQEAYLEKTQELQRKYKITNNL